MREKGKKIQQTIQQHIINNSKEYIIVTLIFIIGIFLGVMFVNNMQETQKTEIKDYITHFVEKMKSTENLDEISILKTSIGQNILLTIIIWFFGTTVIRNTSSFWNCSI